jgi:hypothetical protein
MNFCKVVFSLTLLGSTFAAPYAYRGHKQGNTLSKTVVRTVYVTKNVGRNPLTPLSALALTLEPSKVTSTKVFTSNHTNYMVTVNEYRVKLGVSKLV